MSEKLSLTWNYIQSKVSTSFGLLREEDYLHDVTLVADDNKQLPAHRLVLSACSSYFKEIFRNNAKFSHPLLCLNGLQSEDLTNILDYMYNGQVSIHLENLDRFLDVAQRFKLQGLKEDHQHEEKTAQKSLEINRQVSASDQGVLVPVRIDVEKDSDQDVLVPVRTDEQIPESSTKEQGHMEKGLSNIKELEEKINKYLEKSGAGLDVVEIPDDDIEDDDSEEDDEVEIEEQINEYLEVIQDGSFKCTLCGKTSNLFTNLKSHIETHFNLKLYQQISSRSK